MGKPFKWFRALLGLIKPDPLTFQPDHPFSNVPNRRPHHSTAAVHRTSDGRSLPLAFHLTAAAIKIQAAFRRFLARKALRALRGLVRLQALVRGHIERKRTAERIQQMQTFLKTQAQVRARQSQSHEFLHQRIKSSSFFPLDPVTPEKSERSAHTNRFKQMQRTGSRFTTIDVEKIDRILEFENHKTYHQLKPKSLFRSMKLALSSDVPSQFSRETQCFSQPFKFTHEVEESSFFSVSSRDATKKKTRFTPTKSYRVSSYFSGGLEYPSYMACTESSKAKMRSQSTPRQPPQYEKSSSAKPWSGLGFA